MKRYRSAILIEAIVAMVIIISVAAIAVMIFIQIYRTTSSNNLLTAESLAEKYIRSVNKPYPGMDSSFSENNFHLRIQLTEGTKITGSDLLLVSVFSADEKMMIRRSKLISK